MERVPAVILGAGVVLGVFFAVTQNVFMGISIFIILLTVAMCLQIMGETRDLPEVSCRLSDDAKAVIVANGGNAPAKDIHVALVPMDIEFDIPELGADEEYAHPLASMATELKVAATYANSSGQTYKHTWRLSSLDENDPLKPMFPMFSWKKDD
ncbi:hypothetical protein E2N92_11770 [Methanofollis formosanus]|uniref:Uncharacterized protein n=1 Tax=Methanofollis formosanus TaxID=299308 RepID=A0A8G1EHA6_9EURY|nr:hypothetical protein [Methanofollis formosanus]QYZ80054.1 hypothetical protein E2N92_11770 [Methanofollis formosanus]